MKALSIRQPWAWAILTLGKRHENRTWMSGYRGEVLIHAAKGCTGRECQDALAFMAERDLLPYHDDRWPGLDGLDRGGIVGVANVVDCVTKSDSPWFVGPAAFVLDDVRPLPFVACRGALGFWNVPAEVEARVREALAP